MWTLRIDHRVSEFEAWKRAFDSDPIGREAAGVRQHRILRRCDEPDHVAIELDFNTVDQAEQMLGRLRTLWGQVEPTGLIIGPQADIFEQVEREEY